MPRRHEGKAAISEGFTVTHVSIITDFFISRDYPGPRTHKSLVKVLNHH